MKKLVLTLLIGVTTLTAFSQVPSYVPTNGLVGYWPFNGNANDESGNNNNGTVNEATLTNDRNGVANKAYSFDGLNDNILINNNFFNNGWSEFTVSIWYNLNQQPNSNNGNSSHILFNTEPHHGIALTMNWGSSNKYSLWLGDGAPSNSWNALFNSKSTQTISLNTWRHIVINKIAEKYYLYIDGNLDVIWDSPILVQSYLTKLYFGSCDPLNSSEVINGKLDDIAIYNRTLTQQEITALYNGCTHETATSNSLNGIILKNATPINLTASPSLDGQFSGDAISNNKFTPTNAHLGKNTIQYNFTNSSGCKDSTDFSVIVYDTLGNVCSTYDTLKIKVKFTLGLYANTINTIKFYPNPTKDVLIIDNGNYQAMSGYSLKIVSLAGKVVYNQPITSQQVQISMNQIATKGLYIAQIIDSNNAIVDSKKIVLE